MLPNFAKCVVWHNHVCCVFIAMRVMFFHMPLAHWRCVKSLKPVRVLFYYIDERVLLGTKPLVDSIRHFIRDPSGVFSVSPLWVSYRSMTSGVSLTLYLNSLVYHRNIFGSSSEVFRNLRTSSEILGKCSGTFVWCSEQFWKIFGNLRKVVGNLRKIIENAVISMSI